MTSSYHGFVRPVSDLLRNKPKRVVKTPAARRPRSPTPGDHVWASVWTSLSSGVTKTLVPRITTVSTVRPELGSGTRGISEANQTWTIILPPSETMDATRRTTQTTRIHLNEPAVRLTGIDDLISCCMGESQDEPCPCLPVQRMASIPRAITSTRAVDLPGEHQLGFRHYLWARKPIGLPAAWSGVAAAFRYPASRHSHALKPVSTGTVTNSLLLRLYVFHFTASPSSSAC